MEAKQLQSRIEGKVTTRTDAAYENLRREIVWNRLTPARYPELIVQVATEHDVIETIRFARTHRMKISVRGGGHSWVGFPLREGSLLIDVGRLNQISIDPQSRLATIQPAVAGRELNRQLAPYGLAFPVGHCGTVALSGFLLSGGFGWNSNTWGPACFSIEAANVVTADGKIVIAGRERDADLLWAVRGGGPGFFGVVTQYVVRLYPAPRAITSSNYFYPLQRIDELGLWAAGIARQLPTDVELTIFCAPAPPELVEQCRSCNGFVTLLSATVFFDNADDARAALAPLESCPVVHDCLQKQVNQPTPMDTLLQMSALLWPERQRYLADTVWSNSSPAQPLAELRDHFLRAPSKKSLAACVFPTGNEAENASLPDAALSITAKTLLLCYAIWDQPEDDAANAMWHREAITALNRFAVGHYVGESDIVTKPTRAERCFAPANWERLNSLRRRYDPDGLFHGHF
jgi:FAD/FMN-containing dehydrogenase